MAMKKKIMPPNEIALHKGLAIHKEHNLFSRLYDLYGITISGNKVMGNNQAACVQYKFTAGRAYPKYVAEIFLNKDYHLSPEEWAYTLAHCELHLAFGHFDANKMPGYDVEEPDGAITWKVSCDTALWNHACDIYIAKFLTDIKFFRPTLTART